MKKRSKADRAGKSSGGLLSLRARDTVHQRFRKNLLKREKKTVLGFYQAHKRLSVVLGVLCFLLLLLGVAALYISRNYTVTNVYVEGNTRYTDEEITKQVMEGRFGDNSIYLAFKYRNKSIRDIPFIERMDVTIVSPDTIRINVYEKALAGYIRYLGKYMYFDREGIVVESSNEPTAGIPMVMGLDFNYVVLYEKLPVENETVFARILDITQLLRKYSLNADRIFFDSKYDVSLYFGDVEVDIGGEDYIDEKIIQVQYILPSLEGKKGVLRMQEYGENTNSVTFEERQRRRTAGTDGESASETESPEEDTREGVG